MPSSITLTVSHLPTSTSFFLSALQPLNYGYRCRSGQTIGFGPTSPPDTPPDFWITQEIPGVPAGAAHVAFPASSHDAVQKFFVAALKAGGKIHGEPTIRDQSGYYSAAVIDFDGNSIEAVYRPGSAAEQKENDVRSLVLQKSEVIAPSTVARTAVSRAPSQVKSVAGSHTQSQVRSMVPSQAQTMASQQPRGDALDTILNEARSAANVARELVNQVRPNLDKAQSQARSMSNVTQSRNDKEGPGEVIMGTLVGVAAGAALHYAFSSRSKHSHSPDSFDDPRARRPSVTGRSMTEPPTMSEYYRDDQSLPRYRALEGPPHLSSSSQYSRAGSQYISMQDNDRPSEAAITIRPTGNRRYSFDSGFVSGSATSTNSMSPSSRPKLIETAPPPSSYRNPTALTRSSSRKSTSRSSSSSRITSRSNNNKSSTHHRRDSGYVEPQAPESERGSAKTILHITEHRKIKEVSPQQPVSRPVSTTSSYKTAKSNSSSMSKSTIRPSSKKHSEDPRTSFAPPSRAATWTAGGGGSGTGSHRERKVAEASVISSSAKSNDTKSVIGKKRDVARLDLPKGELRPDDSVSQVGSSVAGKGSQRSSRR